MASRAKFARWMRRVDAADLVFLDESGANIAMSRTHSWVLKGAISWERRPMCWGNNLTMIGAITATGWLVFTTQYATANRERFTKWVREKLAPRLRPGQTVVMDNLQAHKDPRVLAAIRRRGARVKFLPPYSPDLNPIEGCWALVKKELRRVAPRQPGALRAQARRARHRVRAVHARRFTLHSGYRSRSIRS